MRSKIVSNLGCLGNKYPHLAFDSDHTRTQELDRGVTFQIIGPMVQI